MRDPMTLAYSIKRPWPDIRTRIDSPRNDARGWFNWTVRLHRKPYPNLYISPFVYVGKYELYFPEIIGIWHTDPLGDAGPPCHGRKFWKFHIQHMSIQWSFWQNFVQKHITKCSWCGGKSNKEQGRVNHTSGHMRCHALCLSAFINSLHDHDPATCYMCKQKRLPEIRPNMPYEQRELLDGLRVQIELGLMDTTKAVSLYNLRKKDGWQ